MSIIFYEGYITTSGSTISALLEISIVSITVVRGFLGLILLNMELF
jgi:hypothetical protein